MSKQLETDILVIGSGIAGLSYALKTAELYPEARILVITKSGEAESNTRLAQGGIAVTTDLLKDSFENHVTDTLKAGDGLCDRHIVEMVINEAPQRLRELEAWGARFDRDAMGAYHLCREGGHSAPRVVHHADITGLEIEWKLLARVHATPNINLLTHCLAIELLVNGTAADEKPVTTACKGALFYSVAENYIFSVAARSTLLATGGAGQVYRITTNPEIATGDGIAIAARAGAQIRDLQFIQFHPTALYSEKLSPAFLISEAVRGAGAVLLNHRGERFMKLYDPRADLASRDKVALAIENEMIKSGRPFVYLDCRNIEPWLFKKNFPNILARCLAENIDPLLQPVPVAPAAHYMCGGISTDDQGRTSISGLFACGECAHTGLHGANRLASNSLLEAVVFSHRAALATQPCLAKKPVPVPEEKKYVLCEIPAENLSCLKQELNDIMNEHAGIRRSGEGLSNALKRLDSLDAQIDLLYPCNAVSFHLCELRNLVEVARLIVAHSLSQRENRGSFFNADLLLKHSEIL